MKSHRISTIPEKFYLSDIAKIKPKALHEIEMMYRGTVAELGKDDYEEPKVVIVADTELGRNTGGRYNAAENVLYIKPVLDRKDLKHSIIHELYHWVDSEEYRKKETLSQT